MTATVLAFPPVESRVSLGVRRYRRDFGNGVGETQVAEAQHADWNRAITAYLRAERAAGKADQTIGLRRAQLCRIANGLDSPDPWTVTEPELLDWLGRQQWARETLRSHRATLIGFYAWARLAGHVLVSPAAGLPRVKPSPPSPKPTPHRGYERALQHAKGWEPLALQLGALAGLRRGEIVRIHEHDLVEDLVGTTLIVHGKGGKDRPLPLVEPLASAVRTACRQGGGWAFPGQVDGHMSAAYLGKRLAALLPPGYSAHSLRHKYASDARRQGVDLRVIQTALGHASLDTTQRYTKVDDADLRRAMQIVAGLAA